MFRKIEEVQIGGEAPGEAFGGLYLRIGCSDWVQWPTDKRFCQRR